LKTKLRGEARDDESAEVKRKVHQLQLLQLRCQEGKARYSGTDGTLSTEPTRFFRRFESYKKDTLLPREIKQNRILVDKRAESIILPLFGMAVPFHISTLKNISKSEESDFIYLRLNFNTPGQIAKKDEILPFDDPNANFVRSFTFRSTEIGRYNELFREITDLKRDVTKKETQRREMADLVEQDRLIESKRPAAILTEVTVRPSLEGKKLPGDVQIHQNGLRYAPIRGDQRIDILFSNIKHLFFQPCDNELYVILHCHLKNPIMVGKKKTKDVQFLREASDAAFDETSNRRRRFHHGDEDELAAEQEERRRRQKLNREFKLFAEKIYEVVGF
jgi:nucleosome binding factor SPN SPT16 subunit